MIHVFDNLNEKIKSALKAIRNLIPDEAETLTDFFVSAKKSGNPVEIRSDCQTVDLPDWDGVLVVGDSYFLELKSVTIEGKEFLCKIIYGFLSVDFKPEDQKKLFEAKAKKLNDVLSWAKANFPEIQPRIVGT